MSWTEQEYVDAGALDAKSIPPRGVMAYVNAGGFAVTALLILGWAWLTRSSEA